MSVTSSMSNPVEFIRDACFPFSISIENVGLQSSGENGILMVRRKYNRVKKSFTLHYSGLSENEFELLVYFYENECDYGLKTFYWRYPILNSDSSSTDIGHYYQNKVFYVYITKFVFKAVTYNHYQGDIILSEM